MRIVRPDFSKVTYGRAAIRFFGMMLSDLTMFVGYLMVGFDPQRRALHDYIADTRVIKHEQWFHFQKKYPFIEPNFFHLGVLRLNGRKSQLSSLQSTVAG